MFDQLKGKRIAFLMANEGVRRTTSSTRRCQREIRCAITSSTGCERSICRRDEAGVGTGSRLRSAKLFQ